MIKIKSDNITFRLIQLTFGSDTQPPDLCSFFWLGVISWLSLPLTYVWMVLNKLMEMTTKTVGSLEDDIPYIGRIFLSFCAWFAAFFIILKSGETQINSLLISFCIILPAILLILGLFFVIFWAISKFEKIQISKYRLKQEEHKNLFIQSIKAIKDKHCRLIEYED